MKIIDLLNKKRNDEELPKKFKYDDNVFVYDNEQNDYIYEYGNISFFNDYCSPIYNFGDCLATFDKEIEIIEEVEDKEYEDIEELDVALLAQCDNWLRCPTNEVTKQDIELNPYIIDNVRENTLEFQRKINVLIRNQKKIIEVLNDNNKNSR